MFFDFIDGYTIGLSEDRYYSNRYRYYMSIVLSSIIRDVAVAVAVAMSVQQLTPILP